MLGYTPKRAVHAEGGAVSINTDVTLVATVGHTYSKNMDQPGKVANPARGQLNRVN